MMKFYISCPKHSSKIREEKQSLHSTKRDRLCTSQGATTVVANEALETNGSREPFNSCWHPFMVNNNKPRHSIVVETWNVNGIREKTEESLLFLDEDDVSMLSVSETLLKSTVRQGLRGFQCFRREGAGRGGGVAVFVRNGIAARQVSMETNVESVAVEVVIGDETTRFVAV